MKPDSFVVLGKNNKKVSIILLPQISPSEDVPELLKGFPKLEGLSKRINGQEEEPVKIPLTYKVAARMNTALKFLIDTLSVLDLKPDVLDELIETTSEKFVKKIRTKIGHQKDLDESISEACKHIETVLAKHHPTEKTKFVESRSKFIRRVRTAFTCKVEEETDDAPGAFKLDTTESWAILAQEAVVAVPEPPKGAPAAGGTTTLPHHGKH